MKRMCDFDLGCENIAKYKVVITRAQLGDGEGWSRFKRFVCRDCYEELKKTLRVSLISSFRTIRIVKIVQLRRLV
jgi:hypothetical protein